jgi:hypothetical protein
MKILIDMNLSPLWVPFLSDRGVEALHWSSVGEPDAADSEIFDFAASDGWVVFTHDPTSGFCLQPSGHEAPACFRSVVRMCCRPPSETSCPVRFAPLRRIWNRIRLLPI